MIEKKTSKVKKPFFLKRNTELYLPLPTHHEWEGFFCRFLQMLSTAATIEVSVVELGSVRVDEACHRLQTKTKHYNLIFSSVTKGRSKGLKAGLMAVWVPPLAYGLERYSRPRAQFLPIRTSQPVNNIYLWTHIWACTFSITLRGARWINTNKYPAEREILFQSNPQGRNFIWGMCFLKKPMTFAIIYKENAKGSCIFPVVRVRWLASTFL